MNPKILTAGIFFALILLSGYWLSRVGKPYNVLILTIHKLISLGAIVFLGITINRMYQATPPNPPEIASSVATLALFIIMLATGGVLSTAKPKAGLVHKLHQVIPYLVILTTAANLYLPRLY